MSPTGLSTMLPYYSSKPGKLVSTNDEIAATCVAKAAQSLELLSVLIIVLTIDGLGFFSVSPSFMTSTASNAICRLSVSRAFADSSRLLRSVSSSAVVAPFD